MWQSETTKREKKEKLQGKQVTLCLHLSIRAFHIIALFAFK